MEEGAHVTLCNLTSSPELNGRPAVVVEAPNADGRVGVYFADGRGAWINGNPVAIVRVKLQNIRMAGGADVDTDAARCGTLRSTDNMATSSTVTEAAVAAKIVRTMKQGLADADDRVVRECLDSLCLIMDPSHPSGSAHAHRQYSIQVGAPELVMEAMIKFESQVHVVGSALMTLKNFGIGLGFDDARNRHTLHIRGAVEAVLRAAAKHRSDAGLQIAVAMVLKTLLQHDSDTAGCARKTEACAAGVPKAMVLAMRHAVDERVLQHCLGTLASLALQGDGCDAGYLDRQLACVRSGALDLAVARMHENVATMGAGGAEEGLRFLDNVLTD